MWWHSKCHTPPLIITSLKVILMPNITFLSWWHNLCYKYSVLQKWKESYHFPQWKMKFHLFPCMRRWIALSYHNLSVPWSPFQPMSNIEKVIMGNSYGLRFGLGKQNSFICLTKVPSQMASALLAPLSNLSSPIFS